MRKSSVWPGILVLAAAFALSPSVARLSAQSSGKLGPPSGGEGVTFPVRAPAGTVALPSYSFTNDPAAGLYWGGLGQPILGAGTNGGSVAVTPASGTGGVNIAGGLTSSGVGGTVSLTGTTSTANTGGSISLSGGLGSGGNRSGGNIVLSGGIPSGTGLRGRVSIAADTWTQLGAGRVALASNYTNATTTFSNTVLTPGSPVVATRRYSFEAKLFVTESVAAEGAKLDFAGGTATSTNFVASCILYNAVGTPLAQANAVSAALATVINIAAFTDTAVHTYICSGTFEPATTGTFILRAAQNSHATGTLTIQRGSYLWVDDL